MGFLWFWGGIISTPAQIAITEFMANNGKTLADPEGDYSDWIELFNGGTSAVELAGWRLTDDAADLNKWRFPGGAIAPGGYLIVFASGKDRSVAGSPWHTNFRLEANGEYLALVRPDGGIASEFAPVFPEQLADTSYGVWQGTNYYFKKPTPGSVNATGFIAVVADTKFSHDRGFYDTPFTLSITTETTHAVVRYTTNGVPPSATNGLIYTGPILISGTTTLRAAAFLNGYLPSNVDTQSYLFLDDVLQQSPTGQPPPGWPSSWGANSRDYGMDPDVVNNPLYKGTIKNDLKSIPSFSVVMDLNDLFNSTRGIYANPGQDGRDWERPTSLELIHPDGQRGFQINGGIRIRGGFSRTTSNPKHAFRFFFREDYGAAKLKYPLFGDGGTDTFDALDLRTFQNYSWSFQGDSRGVFLRDQFSRDLQLAMGHPGERGGFYHLYVNGQYWGLYNTCERPEASYGAAYFGGNAEDYDVIKVEAGAYTINATDGNMTAWTRLYTLAKAGLETTEAYQNIQGNNPDGTRNPDYEVLVDLPNLIDYMLVIFYGGNLDAPISNFLSNTRPNNWYGVRNRRGTEGFRFFAHDAEHTLLNVNEDRTGPFSAGDTSVVYSSPQYLWKKLQANAEFRLLAADRIHRYFFNKGLLMPEATRALFLTRKAEIDRAVVGESARWGDAKRAAPFTRDVDWVRAINDILNNFFPQRTAIVLNQLRADGFYPNVSAPVFSQHGGNISRGFGLTVTASAGTVYFTRDGSDPRLPGGGVAPSALVYSAPVALNESVQVKSRLWSNGTWSALNEASFTVIQTFRDLVITELMYDPLAQDGIDGDEFEFIELKNVGALELDLSGVRFTNGVGFAFPNGFHLGPGQFAVLAGNPEPFQKRYPGVRISGVYAGRLANSGETVALVHAVGTPIATVKYGDQPPWPATAAGRGFSLVLANPSLNPEPGDPKNWRASTKIGGSPGADDPPSSVEVVWITEILTHTDLPQKDTVELHNPTTHAVDIGSWYLTDDRATPKKFRLAPGTIIPPGGYWVLTEDDFNRATALTAGFNFSSHGEEVYLYAADAAGNLTGFSDGFSFPASANGVSFGRYVTSTGEVQYPPQIANSFGAGQTGPRVGPVVINEIHYHPAPGSDEFIELKNVTSQSVKLYDPERATNRWRINGVGFDFPAFSELPAHGLALIVASDPVAFRTRNGVPSSVPVFGPFPGVLQNGGELLQLQRPDAPDVATNGIVFVPFLTVDEVRYGNQAPWPTHAAGGGPSLERINALAYGNDPIQWRASFGTPSPGIENGGNRAPRVSIGPERTLEASVFPVVLPLTGSADDDGFPTPPGALTVAWTQLSGPGPVGFGDASRTNTTASFPGVGRYVVRLTAHDGELSGSAEMTVAIQRLPSQVTLVSTGAVWRYLDAGSNQGTAWVNPGFNDSAWSSGKAQLGYGDGDEGTVVKFGPNSQTKYTTTYFRRSFAVENARGFRQLTLRLLRDDGAVVYLNGTEVFRSNMPEGPILSSTFASSNVSGTNESAFLAKQVDPSLLTEGSNSLAVEIHQSDFVSADISFDLELKGLWLPDNQPPTISAGADQTLSRLMETTLKGTAFDDGLPSPPGRLTISWSMVSGPGVVTLASPDAAVTVAKFSASGRYVLRLSVGDGEFSVQDETVIQVEDPGIAVWKAKYFNAAELADAAMSGDAADPDGDGQSNAEEYVTGTDPRNGASVLKVNSAERTLRGVAIRFQAMAGKTYTVQYRDTLTGGEWRSLSDVDSRTDSYLAEILDPSGAGLRYYRVVTPQQP